MKTLIFLVNAILLNSFLQAQYVVGSVINGQPSVSLNTQDVQSTLNLHFAQYDGSANVILDSMKIEDEDLNDTADEEYIIYYYRIQINSEANDLMIASRYKLNYHPNTNEYELDEADCEAEGGKFSCAKENCKGCNPGKSNGDKVCTPECTPIDAQHTTKCTPVWGPPSSGGGWGSILTGISALGTLIATIMGWL